MSMSVAFWLVMAGFVVCLWRISGLRRDVDILQIKLHLLLEDLEQLHSVFLPKTTRRVRDEVVLDDGSEP